MRPFKPGVRLKAARAWFLEIVLVRTSVCACLCLPSKALITSGVIWCDIGRVRLNKFYDFPLLLITLYYMTLAVDRWMSMAILTQHIMNACQRKLR